MDKKVLNQLADFICGTDVERFPLYRTHTEIIAFLRNLELLQSSGHATTRGPLAKEVLNQCSDEQINSVILRLVSPKEYGGDHAKIRQALSVMNDILKFEELKVQLNGAVPFLSSCAIEFELDDAESDEKGAAVHIPPPAFLSLGLEPGIGEILAERWNEAQICVDQKAYLSATILMGSLLEGMLLGVMQRKPREANQAPTAPKDKGGNVKNFADWSLSQMIDTAHSVGWFDLDVKRFSHSLREFRNLVHPYEQWAVKAKPDIDTCKISWQVVQAAVNDLAIVLASP